MLDGEELTEPSQDTVQGSALSPLLALCARQSAITRPASDTLTYTLILEGEITYITEGDDIVVREGDALIQLGNVHSWRNTSGASVLLAVVRAAADPLGRLVT